MEENIESENNLYLTDQTLEGLDFSPNWEHSSHLSSKKKINALIILQKNFI